MGRIRLQLGELLKGLTRAEAGPFLQKAPQQHETQQHHGFVEEAGPAHLGPDQSHNTGDVGTANPEPNQRIHAGGPSASGSDTTDQDGAAGPDQRNSGQSGMKGKTADQGEREVTGLTEVAQHRQQQ